jgi:predicted nuclease of predicted toxin-antitoxin system
MQPLLRAVRKSSRSSRKRFPPMKFLVDAQLPRSLAVHLAALGHDVAHVKDLPAGSLTTDSEITSIADADGRIVVTKDADFRHMHETGGHPERLLLVAVGNTRNRELLDHFTAHHATIVGAFDEADFVELGRETLTLHRRRTR